MRKLSRMMCLVGVLASGTALAAPAKLSIYSQATATWRDASIRFVHMTSTNIQVSAQTATGDWVYCNISGSTSAETRDILSHVRATVNASGGAVLCYVPQHSVNYPASYYVSATGYALNFNGPL